MDRVQNRPQPIKLSMPIILDDNRHEAVIAVILAEEGMNQDMINSNMNKVFTLQAW